jgi:hypothetical protein
LTLPARTSPTANTPGRLLSSIKGGRESGPRRIPIWVNIHWQIAPCENKAFLIEGDNVPQPLGVRGGAGHDEEVMRSHRTHLSGLLVGPTHFFENVLSLKAA